MAKFTESQRKLLLSNPNVFKVTGSNVSYTPAFKIKAVKSYLAGQSPIDIFNLAKIDLSCFDGHYAKHTIRRWRKIFEEAGEEGLAEENRGSKATGRPKAKFNSVEEELEFLRMENYLLKKLHALAEQKEKKSSR